MTFMFLTLPVDHAAVMVTGGSYTPRKRIADVVDLSGRFDVLGPPQQFLEEDLHLQRADVLA
jgi:hypothetical protein